VFNVAGIKLLTHLISTRLVFVWDSCVNVLSVLCFKLRSSCLLRLVQSNWHFQMIAWKRDSSHECGYWRIYKFNLYVFLIISTMKRIIKYKLVICLLIRKITCFCFQITTPSYFTDWHNIYNYLYLAKYFHYFQFFRASFIYKKAGPKSLLI